MKPPMIVVGPSIPEGEQREAFVYLQDIMATTLDLAGIEKPDYVEFSSLMPLIEDAANPGPREVIYGCFTPTLQRMIRAGDHKLIVYPGAEVVRLYNLASDPLELTDLAGNPEHKPTIQKLFARLLRLQQELDDPLDLAVAFPDLAP